MSFIRSDYKRGLSLPVEVHSVACRPLIYALSANLVKYSYQHTVEFNKSFKNKAIHDDQYTADV